LRSGFPLAIGADSIARDRSGFHWICRSKSKFGVAGQTGTQTLSALANRFVSMKADTNT
jgi:hypothetical protein